MDVTIKGAGITDNVEAQVDPTMQALRTALRPQEYIVGGVVGGHYSAAFPTGSVTGRTAGDVLMGMRWASPAKLMVIKRISVAATIATAQAGTIQEIDWDLIRLVSCTTNYVTGSTKQVFRADSHKLRSTMAPSEFVNYGDVYCSTTGASTGQTATLDALPMSYACPPIAAPTATYAGNLGMVDLFKQDKMAEHPVVLANGEGLAIRVGTTQGATVAVKNVFIFEWFEVTAY